jgi:hypothetical protein
MWYINTFIKVPYLNEVKHLYFASLSIETFKILPAFWNVLLTVVTHHHPTAQQPTETCSYYSLIHQSPLSLLLDSLSSLRYPSFYPQLQWLIILKLHISVWWCGILLLCLANFILQSDLQLHSCCPTYQDSILLQTKNIFLCIYTRFS